jgi:hypothetical protein
MFHALRKLCRWFLGVGTPWVELLQLPSMAPPMVGSTFAYLSSFILGVRPNHPLGRPGGESTERDITGVFAGTLPILRCQCPLTPRVSGQCLATLAPPQLTNRHGP